jgi:hypothetical protein
MATRDSAYRKQPEPWIRASWLWLVLVAALLLLPCLVRGDCGLALAYPVEGIQIDGNLADWPGHLPWYPVGFRLFGPPTDPEDCSARFRVGYSEAENALYVAVDVQDEERAAVGRFPLMVWTNELAVVVVEIKTARGVQQNLGCLRGRFATNTFAAQ